MRPVMSSLTLLFFTIGSLAAALAGGLPGAGWILLRNADMAHLYLLGTVPVLWLVLARVGRSWLWLTVLLPLLYSGIRHGQAYYPLLLPSHDASCAVEPRGPALSVMLLKAGEGRVDSACFHSLFARTTPNLIGVLQATPELRADISRQFPFSLEASPGGAGSDRALVLASSHELTLERTSLGDQLPPLVRARLGGDRPLIVSLVEFEVPRTDAAVEARQITLRRLLSLARASDAPEIVFGEFALTPALKVYRQFVWAGNFANALSGFAVPMLSLLSRSPALAIRHHILVRDLPDVQSLQLISDCGVGVGSQMVVLGAKQ